MPTCVPEPNDPTLLLTVAKVKAEVPAVELASPLKAGNCDDANEPVIALKGGAIVTAAPVEVTKPFAFTVKGVTCVALLL